MKTIIIVFAVILAMFSGSLFGQGKDDLSAGEAKFYKYVKYISGKKIKDFDKMVEELVIPAKTIEDTLLLFFFWHAENIAYDTCSFTSGNIQNYTVEETIKRGEALCSGYANVFKAMCDKVGITCYIINGYSKGFGYKQGTKFERTDHAWILVYINDEYKFIDPTWGAGYVAFDNGQLKYYKKLNMAHFLAKPEFFIGRHLPGVPMWQILEHIVDMKTYVKYDNAEDMLKHASKSHFNYADSISAWVALEGEEKIIKLAESGYRFFPDNAQNLAIAYYNYAVTLSQESQSKEKLLKSLHFYNKARNLYDREKIKGKTKMMGYIDQGEKYVKFYLEKLE